MNNTERYKYFINALNDLEIKYKIVNGNIEVTLTPTDAADIWDYIAKIYY